MGKSETGDLKKAEKKAMKRAKKEAKKEAKRIKKEEKRREKEQRRQNKESESQSNESRERSQVVPISKHFPNSDASVKDSVFYKKRIHVSLSLMPADLKNIRAALEESVRAMILKYTPKIGVLMTFEKIHVISNQGHGIMLNELPNVHYKIAFDGLVFNPHVGCKVSNGKIESAKSRIKGCDSVFVLFIIICHSCKGQ